MKLHWIAVLASLALSGCASVYSVAVGPEKNDVYGGVRLDARIIGSAAMNERGNCGVPDCDEPSIWLFASGAVCDLPLSLIADTLLLPYTVIRAAVAEPDA